MEPSQSPMPNIRICYEDVPCRQLRWQDSLCILYQLAGKSKVTLDGQQYLMHEADVMVINPYELYNAELLGSSSFLSFQFSAALIAAALPGLRFHCLSFLAPRKQANRFDHLRVKLAALFQSYLAKHPDGELELLSRAYDVFYVLKLHFCTGAVESGGNSRIHSILAYLNTHYAEKITLSGLAKQEFVSANYLSQLFRDRLNTTFTQYLTDIRLSHAFFELCNTDKSITDIALDNGFGRLDTLINRFLRKYSVTPSKYRRGITKVDTADPKLIPQSLPQKRYHALLRYTAPRSGLNSPPIEMQHLYIPLSGRGPGTPVTQDWKTMINAGYADDCLTVEVQQQLTDIQDLIHFEYIRFHGIFNDSMHIYYEDKSGAPNFHFAHIDLLLDRLLMLGFKPYIEFGFLPQLLSQTNCHVYQNFCYIGFPVSLSKWETLVQQFVFHCIERYGINAVRQWKFTLFSITFALYGFLSIPEYQQLYRSTYMAVKKATPNLSFGGPGVEGSLLLEPDNPVFRQFLQFCLAEHCVPDFITMHSFPHTLSDIINSFNRIAHQKDTAAAFCLSENPNFMADAIDAMQSCLQNLHLARLPIIIDEWESTIWQWDLHNDTCYKSAHIIKNLAETMGRTAGKAYWTVSDLVGDQKMEPSLFHGGHGLYTYNGIRKPSLHAFSFLAHMGSEIISSGSGWYATRSAQGIQLLLYNYCHYQTEYRFLSELPQPESRYLMFQNSPYLCCHISISDLPGSRFSCEYFTISCDSGSAFDEWIRLGSPSELTPDNLTYLKHRAEPMRRIEQRASLRDLEVTLGPLEVVQILIYPCRE